MKFEVQHRRIKKMVASGAREAEAKRETERKIAPSEQRHAVNRASNVVFQRIGCSLISTVSMPCFAARRLSISTGDRQDGQWDAERMGVVLCRRRLQALIAAEEEPNPETAKRKEPVDAE